MELGARYEAWEPGLARRFHQARPLASRTLRESFASSSVVPTPVAHREQGPASRPPL